MPEEIHVQVEGPALLRHGLCALLGAYRDIVIVDAAYTNSGAFVRLTRRPDVIVLVASGSQDSPSAGRSAISHLGTDVAAHGQAAIAVVVPDNVVETISFSRAYASVFLSIHDHPGALHRGVVAAARGEAFCSPGLSPYLVRSVRSNTVGHARYGDVGDACGALSPREQETARLAAAGLSNEEVAQHLHVTVSTVKAHLSEAYAKLGIKRRGQIAARLAVSAGDRANLSAGHFEAPSRHVRHA